MFDKTFFKFALGFIAIVALSMCGLYISGGFDKSDTAETASVR